VVVSCDAVVAGYLGKLSYIVQVIAADIDVQEDRVAVSILLADEVIEMLTDGNQGLRQPRFQIDGIHGMLKVEISTQTVNFYYWSCGLRWGGVF
jgi:hypothetical protein